MTSSPQPIRRLKWVLLLLLSGVAIVVFATTYARPPRPETMAKIWIGFDSDELVFTRLDLRTNFTGFCARVSPADTSLHEYGVEGYRVSNWTFKGWNMALKLTPATTNAEPIYMRGDYDGFSLHLEVGGTTNNWKRSLVLRPEARIENANAETRSTIQWLEQRPGLTSQ
jgi:hypothetical protein